MKTKKIFCLILVISMIFSSFSLIFAEEETNYEIKITNGYGFAGRSNMRVNRGGIVEFKIDQNVKCVTTKEIKDLIIKNKNNFSQEQYSNLTEHYSFMYLGYGASLLRGLFGVKFGDSIDYYKNANNKKIVMNDINDKNLIKAIHDLDEKEYKLTGTISATGKSWISTEPYCFVEVTVLEFEDGKKLKVINTNCTIAERDGTRDAVSGYKLKPLSLIPATK